MHCSESMSNLMIILDQLTEEVYLKRHQTCNWDDNGERDDKLFLEVEKDIYFVMFPHITGVVEGLFDEFEEDNKEESGTNAKL